MRRGDRGIRGSEGKKRGCAEGVAWREGVVGSMGGQATPEFEISHPQSVAFMALHKKTRVFMALHGLQTLSKSVYLITSETVQFVREFR